MTMPVEDEEPLPFESEELVNLEDEDTLASPNVPDDEKSELDSIRSASEASEATGD